MSVLHVVTPGAALRVVNDQLRCVLEKSSRHIPVEQVSCVLLYGQVDVDGQACRLLLSRNIPLIFASRSGKYLGGIFPAQCGNGRVRVAQALAHADPERSLSLAKKFVAGKLRNQTVLLKRRSAPAQDVLASLQRLDAAPDVPSLMGLEGVASRQYFSGLWNTLPEDFQVSRRSRRPPLDPTNALMGLLYAFLAAEAVLALHTAGLDAHIGFLHSLRSGRPALALDLMEEFRPILADSTMLVLFGRNMPTRDDFELMEMGVGVRLRREAFPTVLKAWDERLRSEIFHPLVGGSTTYRNVMACQARLLVRHLLGDADYTPFVTR